MSVRVLRVIARMNVGGPAIHAALLSAGLDARGYQTRLVTGTPGVGEADYLSLYGHEIKDLIEVPALGREIHPVHDAAAYRQIVRIVRDFQPDIVHTHTAKAGLIGRLAARRARVPVVIHTFHGHVFNGYFGRSKEAVFVQAERMAARITTRLVAVNETVRDEVLARGVGRPGQFDVVRLGFDLSPFTSSERHAGSMRAELGLDDTTHTVTIVARLVPIKAHDVFVTMAAEVLRTGTDVVFLIVGDGECRAAIEAQARACGVLSSLRFAGWRRDLDRVYADSDVVVLTSRNEGSPVALIEAMACGRPVVATRAGGVAELVGDAGLLRPIDDAAGLAQDVLHLLANPELAARLGRAGRARVVPAFSRERLIDDIDALYQRSLGARA